MRDAPAAGGRRLGPALVSLGYLFAGLVWIGFSDEVAVLLFHAPAAAQRFQNMKGAAFVVATALLIYVLLLRRERRDDASFASSNLGISPLLVGLVLVTAMPLVALLGYNVYRETRGQLEAANETVRSAANATASQALAYLNEQRRLAGVAAREALGHPGHTGCRVALQDLRRLHEGLLGLAMFDGAGQLHCSAGVAPAAVPPQAPRTSGPTVDVLREGEQAHSAAMTYLLARPLGAVAAVQFIVPLSSLAPIAETSLPDGGVSGLISADGYLLARTPALAQSLGRRIPDDSAFQQARQAGSTSFAAPGADQVDRFHAIRRVGSSGMVAVAGVSLDRIYGPVRMAALASAFASGLVLLLSTLLATMVVRSISRPMRALAETAERAAAGQFDRPAPERGPREIAGVAAQFNRMLDRLPLLEQQLHEREERHRTLIEKLSANIPGMIYQYRMRPDGVLEVPFISSATEWMFELPPQQVMTEVESLIGRMHEDDRPHVLEAIAESARTLKPMIVAYRVQLPSGRLLYHLGHANPEQDPDGSIVWHGCTVDATQLELAQLQLRQVNESLEARVEERTRELAVANEALESFSYSVAHDLRAPLQVIEGFSQALVEAVERGDATRVARYTQRIATNTAAMERMIDGLLAVARVGKGDLQERPVDLGAMVEGVLAELAAPPALVPVVQPLPTVLADPASLRQVWWNLLANAVKFTSRREQPQIEVGCRRENGEVVFWVRDNGAGFDPQFSGRLFGAFQRLHGADEFEGTGVGLALARRVVERHGGRIWAEGRPDAGACFYFSLPAARVVPQG